ncbi:MAG: polysaccharide deacetylase family protein [Anaerovoracaceae bacterium]|jgi:peptidoglycan/xylan/chitin deacetylase (PgdA/CDA1 family)
MQLILIIAMVLLGAFLVYTGIPTVAERVRLGRAKANDDKVIYLTFDDGPSAEYTGKLLDLLDSYHIRASFFIVGEFGEHNKEIIKRMKREGHFVGIHSLEHKSEMLRSPAYTNREFKRLITLFKELDLRPTYFRGAWGEVNLATLFNIKKYGLTNITWNVMAEDWRASITAGEIVRRLKKRVTPGSIVCLHDGRGRNKAPGRTIEALKVTIPYWLDNGYAFKLINEREI